MRQDGNGARRPGKMQGGAIERIRDQVKAYAEEVVGFLYPSRCPVCGKILTSGEGLVCPSCRRHLPWVREPICIRCGKPLADPEAATCADCQRTDHVFDQGRSVFLYEKGLRQSVIRMKFFNHREYIPFYGACLYAGAGDYLSRWGIQSILPIPMHARKRAERGYDQAILLAEDLSRRSGIPVDETSLVRVKYTKASRKLGRDHRRANLRGAFRVRDGAGIREPVLLVDDIYTTGTTMDNAARALRAAGVRQIFFLTLCTGRGTD